MQPAGCVRSRRPHQGGDDGRGGAVPLSEHEQRLFDQIERSLAEDPKFASAVRSTDPRFHARRRIIVAAIAVLLGLAVLIFCVAGGGTLLGAGGCFATARGRARGLLSLLRRLRPQDIADSVL